MGCSSHTNRLKTIVVETHIEGFESGVECALTQPIEVCEEVIKALYKLRDDYARGIE